MNPCCEIACYRVRALTILCGRLKEEHDFSLFKV